MTILGVKTAAPFVHYMKVLKWRTYQVCQVETAQGAETARNNSIDEGYGKLIFAYCAHVVHNFNIYFKVQKMCNLPPTNYFY